MYDRLYSYSLRLGTALPGLSAAPGLPTHLRKPAVRAHDYIRYTTSTLPAVLEIATGHVTAARKPRHRCQVFLALLKQDVRTYPHQ